MEEVNSDSLSSSSFVARIHVLSVAASFLLISGLNLDGHRATGFVEIDGPSVLHVGCLVKFNVSSLVSCSGLLNQKHQDSAM